MIQFKDLSQEVPFKLIKTKYDEALNAGQKNIEAISISSYNKELKEVDSRYINLKFISNDEFVFLVTIGLPKHFLSILTTKYLHWYIGLLLMFKLE